jgi:hypothetical protein
MAGASEVKLTRTHHAGRKRSFGVQPATRHCDSHGALWVMSVAAEAGVSGKQGFCCRWLSASFGGMLTLVGTPPNAIVRGA